MTIILILAIVFLCYTNICALRYIWFIDIYSKYLLALEYYFAAKNLPRDNTYLEYIEMWPTRDIIRKFLTWNLRAFVVHQDRYDEVIQFLATQKQTAKQ